jgi:hypothetical protein
VFCCQDVQVSCLSVQPLSLTQHTLCLHQFVAMKSFMRLAALAVVLCLGSTLVAANDLQIWATVLDCYGK